MWSQFIKTDLYPLLKLVLPLILTGMVSSSIPFFETVFLAHLSQEALAAGALVSWLLGAFVVIMLGTLSALNILISHKYGAQDESGIALVIRDGLLLAVLFSAPAFLFFWNIAPILLLFGQKPQVVALATLYFHALAWGLLPNLIREATLQIIIGLGHTRVVIVFTIFTVVIALFFSYALIFGKFGMPALGISGAGWGTTIGFWITAMVLMVYVLRHSGYQRYFRHLFSRKKPSFFWELLRIGLPMGVMYCFEVGFFFALTLVMGSMSETLMAANQIALQYMGMLMTVIFRIAQAITVRMGHLIGARKLAAAERVVYAGLFISTVLMTVFACIDCFYPNILISIDIDVYAPANFVLVTYVKQLFLVAALFQLLEACRISLFGALRALKDTHFTLISSVICFWGVAFPVGYWLTYRFQLGGPGMWWGMSFGAGLSSLVLFMRFRVKMRS